MKRLLLILKSFFPRRLPIGLSDFNNWVSDCILLSGLPDNESTRRVAGYFILNLNPKIGYISIRIVSNQLIKAASNQVAVQVLKDLGELQNTQGASKEVVSEA